MLNQTFFNSLKKDYTQSNIERRKIISASNEILHDSKRAIFALHRGDTKTAQASLKDLDERLMRLQSSFGFERLSDEGAYVAAVEEYVEAKLFAQALAGQAINKIIKIKISAESYLGGMCDTTGELVRHAVNSATAGKFDVVARDHELIFNIMGKLVELDLTGYLRTKYDQARGNLKKIEDVMYQLKINKLK